MSTTSDGWIKTSDKPEGQDFPWPVLMAKADTGQVHYWRTYREMTQCEPLWREYTHYKPATLPAPPAKEMTQKEQDWAAWTSHAAGHAIGSCTDRTTWFCALAYRDAQNREDLEAIPYCFESMGTARDDAIANLRRRCGLDNGGGK